MKWRASDPPLWKRRFALWPVRIHDEWAWLEWYYSAQVYDQPGSGGLSLYRRWPHELTANDHAMRD